MFLRLLGIAAIAVLVASCKEQPPAPTPTASTVLPRKASEPQVREPVSRFGERVDGIFTIAGSRKTVDGYNEISVVLPGSDPPEQPYRMRFRCDTRYMHQTPSPNGWLNVSNNSHTGETPPPRSASVLRRKVIDQECATADEKEFKSHLPPIEHWMTELYGSIDTQHGVSAWSPDVPNSLPSAPPKAERALRELSQIWMLSEASRERDLILAEPFFVARLPLAEVERYLLAVNLRPEHHIGRATSAAIHLLLLERDAKSPDGWNRVGQRIETDRMEQAGFPPKLTVISAGKEDWMLLADACGFGMGGIDSCYQERWVLMGNEFVKVLQLPTKFDYTGGPDCGPRSDPPRGCDNWTTDFTWSGAMQTDNARFPTLLARKHGTMDLCGRTEKINLTQSFDFVSGGFVERQLPTEFHQFTERAKHSPLTGISALSAFLEEPNNTKTLITVERSRDARSLLTAVSRTTDSPHCYYQLIPLLDEAIKLDPRSWLLYVKRSDIAWHMYEQELAASKASTKVSEIRVATALERAHSAAIQFVASNTANGEAWAHLAVVMTHQGRSTDLVEIIERALRLGKDMPKIRVDLRRAADADITGKLNQALIQADEKVAARPPISAETIK